MAEPTATLVLKDGTTIRGKHFGAKKSISGEVGRFLVDGVIPGDRYTWLSFSSPLQSSRLAWLAIRSR